MKLNQTAIDALNKSFVTVQFDDIRPVIMMYQDCDVEDVNSLQIVLIRQLKTIGLYQTLKELPLETTVAEILNKSSK